MEDNKTMMEQFINCLKNNPDHAFDFIANEYYKFSKDELKDMCKELLYGIYHAESRSYISKEDSKVINGIASHNDYVESTVSPK